MVKYGLIDLRGVFEHGLYFFNIVGIPQCQAHTQIWGLRLDKMIRGRFILGFLFADLDMNLKKKDSLKPNGFRESCSFGVYPGPGYMYIYIYMYISYRYIYIYKDIYMI